METVASDLGLLDRKPEYLINAMECAGQRENPHKAGYGEKRRAVFEYIAGLQSALAEAKAEIEKVSQLAEASSVEMSRWQQRHAGAQAEIERLQQALFESLEEQQQTFEQSAQGQELIAARGTITAQAERIAALEFTMREVPAHAAKLEAERDNLRILVEAVTWHVGAALLATLEDRGFGTVANHLANLRDVFPPTK